MASLRKSQRIKLQKILSCVWWEMSTAHPCCLTWQWLIHQGGFLPFNFLIFFLLINTYNNQEKWGLCRLTDDQLIKQLTKLICPLIRNKSLIRSSQELLTPDFCLLFYTLLSGSCPPIIPVIQTCVTSPFFSLWTLNAPEMQIKQQIWCLKQTNRRSLTENHTEIFSLSNTIDYEFSSNFYLPHKREILALLCVSCSVPQSHQ